MTEREQAAFAAVYRDLGPRVYAYVYRRLRHREEAEDLTSETFACAYRAWGRQPVPSVEAWLFTIARNLVVDRARRDRIRRLRLPFLRPAADSATPQEATDTELTVRKLLDELPPAARDAVLLRVVAGLSTAEVAAVLGKEVGTVRMQVYRGLAQLRRRWDQEVAG